jgi:hypothetical protein
VGGDRDVFPMLYGIGEVAASGWPYFWENRLSLGGGARLMPFQHAATDWLSRLRIYAEYVRAVDYFRDPSPAGSPEGDFRAGVNFSSSSWR